MASLAELELCRAWHAMLRAFKVELRQADSATVARLGPLLSELDTRFGLEL